MHHHLLNFDQLEPDVPQMHRAEAHDCFAERLLVQIDSYELDDETTISCYGNCPTVKIEPPAIVSAALPKPFSSTTQSVNIIFSPPTSASLILFTYRQHQMQGFDTAVQTLGQMLA